MWVVTLHACDVFSKRLIFALRSPVHCSVYLHSHTFEMPLVRPLRSKTALKGAQNLACPVIPPALLPLTSIKLPLWERLTRHTFQGQGGVRRLPLSGTALESATVTSSRWPPPTCTSDPTTTLQIYLHVCKMTQV